MKLLLALVLVPSLAFADKSYNDSAQTVTHDCAKEPSVAINGSAGTYTFTGACEKISVNGSSLKVIAASVSKLAINGSSNTVDVDAADKISVTGSSNKVTYKKGVTGAKPKTSSLGTDNKISQQK